MKNILENKLKKDCVKVCFPTLHSCNLIFCYDYKEPNNHKTISTGKPFGEFFYGISVIVDEFKKYESEKIKNDFDNIIKDLVVKSNNDNFILKETIEYHKNRTFEFLENKCLNSDIPDIYMFIKNNFTEKRLWHNPNHPTGILLNELIKLVFKKLDLIYIENDENMVFLENLLSDWVMPILPCVKNYLDLKFDIDICSSWYHKNIYNNESYIKEYITKLYL